MKFLSISMLLLLSSVSFASNFNIIEVKGQAFDKNRFVSCGLILNYEVVEKKMSIKSATEITGKYKFVRVDNGDSSITFENREVLEDGSNFLLNLEEENGKILTYTGVNRKERIIIDIIKKEEGDYQVSRHEVHKKKLFGGEKLLRTCFYK